MTKIILLLAAIISFATKSNNIIKDIKQNKLKELTCTAKQQTDVPYTVATGYITQYNFSGTLEKKIITNNDFNNVFQTFYTKQRVGTAIDFSKQYVIAVVAEELTNGTKFDISVQSLKLKDSIITLTYTQKPGKPIYVSKQNQVFFILIVDNKYRGEIKFEKKKS
jgi:hypothetical protein